MKKKEGGREDKPEPYEPRNKEKHKVHTVCSHRADKDGTLSFNIACSVVAVSLSISAETLAPTYETLHSNNLMYFSLK